MIFNDMILGMKARERLTLTGGYHHKHKIVYLDILNFDILVKLLDKIQY